MKPFGSNFHRKLPFANSINWLRLLVVKKKFCLDLPEEFLHYPSCNEDSSINAEYEHDRKRLFHRSDKVHTALFFMLVYGADGSLSQDKFRSVDN